ncbi:uncharacterized protein K452DRAFT_234301, partial [Aplosporella prunicola CBS 121167]
SVMAAVISPQDPSTSSPTSNPAVALPPLVTSPPSRPSTNSRPPSYANHRFSTMSQTSAPFRSRPQSTVFPVFHSSLSYTLVRDFAYPPFSPLFYGPLPEQRSGTSTPASEVPARRLSDPPIPWDGSRLGWSTGPWGTGGEQLPSTSFGDGPPWSEDEDLHSPVVTSARHKKNKSDFDGKHSRGIDRGYGPRRASYTGTNGDGSQTYYVSNFDEAANGPGGEYITYPADDGGAGNDTSLSVPSSQDERRRDSHFANALPSRSYTDQDGFTYGSEDDISETSSQGGYDADESRYSRDYQFTIASPDEEMHGKAVALFDFARENDNELPLTEGQVILVSYRHGQGWLVAQDPRTGESGLVPEEYVRLLRDIEGGWNGLMNGAQFGNDMTPGDDLVESNVNANNLTSPISEARTPTQHHRDYYTPVVSTFSTSSKDLQKYPQHLLGSQASTPVGDGSFPRRGSKASFGSPKKEAGEEKQGEEGKEGAGKQDPDAAEGG